MANWCNNSVAFYQQDGGNCLLNAFYFDIQRYQNYTDPDTGKLSSWIGFWLKENRLNTDEIYARGDFIDCQLYDDFVLLTLETAWSPLPEVCNKMAEKYNLSFVYIAEEPGMGIYVNTDIDGRFFATKYVLDCFDVTDLELDATTENLYGDRLREIGRDTNYYENFGDVLEEFEGFGFYADDLESLNMCLEKFKIEVREYATE